MGFALEKIMEIALDCYYSPIFMKKNRPAYKLSVIYKACDEEKIEDIIFRETTSIGVRKFDLDRTILDREIIEISYKNKDYLAKQVRYKDKVYTYPEYESAKDLAENEGISLKEAYDLMRALVVKIEK
ncbi:LarC family nickel insertion protein [Anaerococcus degeneri]|uniref:LarC family nickel insertion protein n=1 Tax=Anaerococcus degeneri TaxID=361500 RepID=UPI001D7F3CC4|nr:LarC family nickel insertion protein [Anaerococcus degeneri]MBP2015375.1 uncharacterized protein (DUF111 family) [Anaerococcus degeneri]